MRLTHLVLLFLFLALPHRGEAQLGDVVCDDSNRLEQQLLSRHGAQKQGQGMRGPDAILEVWITPTTGDWALVQTYANGTSCIVAMGEHWETITPGSDPA
jgi:hypothetical protein